MHGAGVGRRQALGLLAGWAVALPCVLAGGLAGCSDSSDATHTPEVFSAANDASASTDASSATQATGIPSAAGSTRRSTDDAAQLGSDASPEAAGLLASEHKAREQAIFEALGVVLDLRPSLDHGQKGADYQRYLVLHDTDVDASAAQIVDAWESQGTGIAAHFVVDKDGAVRQCVDLDRIAHHAGYGDTGHNLAFGVQEDGRDDKGPGAGDFSQPLGPDYADYGMNSHSVGIELVHLGVPGEEYPQAQLDALDLLVEMIDKHYRAAGLADAGAIIDHKAWRTTNPDTSPEFSQYLASYVTLRRHDPQ